MLLVSNLSKRYHNVNVFSQLNFSLSIGDFLIVQGPTGGGKTTLLNILALLEKPSSGIIKFNKKILDFNKMKVINQFRKNNIAMVFQKSNLIEQLTVLENLILVASFHYKNYFYCQKYCFEQLKLFNLECLANNFPSQISLGQAQKIAIIRALIKKSSIIIMDEPTSALDKTSIQEVIAILNKIRKHHLIIMATHNQDIIQNYGNKKLILNSNNFYEEQQNKSNSFPLKLPSNSNLISTKICSLLSLRSFKNNLFSLIIIFIVIFLQLTFLFIGVGIINGNKNINTYQLSNIDRIISVDAPYSNSRHQLNSVYSTLLVDQFQIIGLNNIFSLKYGNLPNNYNQIVVNAEFIKKKFKSNQYDNYIGHQLNYNKIFYVNDIPYFQEQPIIIVGVVEEDVLFDPGIIYYNYSSFANFLSGLNINFDNLPLEIETENPKQDILNLEELNISYSHFNKVATTTYAEISSSMNTIIILLLGFTTITIIMIQIFNQLIAFKRKKQQLNIIKALGGNILDIFKIIFIDNIFTCFIAIAVANIFSLSISILLNDYFYHLIGFKSFIRIGLFDVLIINISFLIVLFIFNAFIIFYYAYKNQSGDLK